MLTSRQRHCLDGIGIRRWRDRDAVAAALLETSETSLDRQQALPSESPAAQIAAMAEHAPQQPPAPVVTAEAPPVAVELPPLDGWDNIVSAIQLCQSCELAQNCTQKVPGVGDRQAKLLIVGEGPGHDEDIRGEPFVGRSGQLLDRMLAAIGIAREQVYITNIVKCRPPNNRDPKVEETQKCRAFLDAQIAQLNPRVILAVGRVSAHNLLDSQLPVGKLIREMHRLPGSDIPLKVTYHPAYLLRNPSAKAIAWRDMKLLHGLLQ